ncbi:MAG: type I-C CRISPR-associated protein Cas8c/Csd1, partial [Bacilli bacterium]|nr:type I-C CRISPR-associated protein Cas8c/Csd1 [Bacilli bacterium]
MILAALCNYYDILKREDFDIPSIGFSKEKIYFEFVINNNAELTSVIPLERTELRGKKEYSVPAIMTVPQSVIKTRGIKSNFLYENAEYAIGFCNSKEQKKIDEAKKKFEEFKSTHHKLLDDCHSDSAATFLKFLDNYDPIKNTKILEPYEKNLEKGLIVFRVNGKYLHEDKMILNIWVNSEEQEVITMQCAVSGKLGNIARLHPKIKGVRDSQSSGASIVSFNDSAYESYTQENSQGLNSPISEEVAFKYTTTLNYLLSSSNQKIEISDSTIVFWAESSQPIYANFINMFLNPPSEIIKDDGVNDIKVENMILAFLENAKTGAKIDFNSLNIDSSTKTYILGLSPNKSRLAIRFFYFNTFDKIIEKLIEHYQDLNIEKQFKSDCDSLPVWRIINEIKKPESSEKPNPLLSGSIMRSIISGTMYPRNLYQSIIKRIRCDRDKEKNIIQINFARVSIIKAYLSRYSRLYNKNSLKEVTTVSLNEQTTQTAYLLGRLFAVLEKAQKDANPKIEATIKDRYFASACATPASVFPVLLKLAQNHISKSDYGYMSDRRITDILNKMEITEFPAYLSLEEQGT